MPIITFIRHAETTYNANRIFAGRIDCGLSEKGIQDTINKFNYKKDDFNVYYCSPLKRCLDTLKLIVKDLDTINIDDRITEVCIGDWEGNKKDSFPEKLVYNFRNGLYTPPNAETPKEVDDMVTSFVSELFDLFDDNTKILVVTHNGVMRSIKRNFVPNYENIMSENLGCIVLDRDNYDYYLNETNLNEKHKNK